MKEYDPRSISRLQFNEEAGTLEIVLLTCRIGKHYYPGNEPLRLAIKGRKEVWGLLIPLLDLVCKHHEGDAVVVHRGNCYLMTHAVWEAFQTRLSDYTESADIGLPAHIEIVAKAFD
jgi:hypothetical protein